MRLGRGFFLGMAALVSMSALTGCDGDDDPPPANNADAGANGDASTNPNDASTPDSGDTIGSADFIRRVIATDLDQPFELRLGPDDMFWVTERTAGRITRIDPANGAKT